MVTAVDANNEKVALLLGKPKNETTITLYVPGEKGKEQEIELRLSAISYKQYDQLLSKYPPTPEQKVQGATYDLDKFAPALISACLVDPEMSLTQARDLWSSDNWSRGDLEYIFGKCVALNHQDASVPFSKRG